jgi:general secretion pathway protein D
MASTSRLTSPALALAIVLVFTTTSCAMLPPSLRGEHDATPPAAPTATAQNDFGPKPGASAKDSGNASTATPPKTYPGTGVFLNQKPAQPPAKPGPEEASLNFESLDVREVAKVILGDYLKETYTVHPAVTGTVTFRTLRPIPMKDLLPTLEMLLRQNNAAVVRVEGVY